MNASVSVIIPCYRCARTIGRAIQSVAEQTVMPSEVILVVDAGDDTLDFLYQKQMEYGRDWVKVFVLNQNFGPAAARNLAWDNAVSDYIAFLDADDAWHMKKIEIQYKWMKSHPEAILTGHSCLVLKEGKMPLSLPAQWEQQQINGRKLLLSNQFATSTVMVCRDIPFHFQQTQRHSEDYLLWLQIVLAGNSAYFLNLPLAFLFKARYGESGLGADLWLMEKGELSNYRRLHDDRMISTGDYCFLIPYSFAKYIYRFIRGRF